MPDPVRILFCPLSTGERSGWWCPTLGSFVADLPHLNGYATAVCPLHQFIPAASARNLICKRVVDEHQEQFDWLCMIDNDMVPPPNLFDAVKDAPAEADIVVPEFWMFDETKRQLKVCWRPIEMGEKDELYETGRGFHEASKAGTGVMFIRPKSLPRIPYPYFTYAYDPDGAQTGTEDIGFCAKARKHGLRIFANNKVLVGHYKTVNLTIMEQMVNKHLDIRKPASVDSEEKADCPSVTA